MVVFNSKFFFFVLMSAFFVSATPISGPIINPENGNTYYLLSSASWIECQIEAENLGGNLVTINNDAENIWVFNTFSNYDGLPRNLWIGFTTIPY